MAVGIITGTGLDLSVFTKLNIGEILEGIGQQKENFFFFSFFFQFQPSQLPFAFTYLFVLGVFFVFFVMEKFGTCIRDNHVI